MFLSRHVCVLGDAITVEPFKGADGGLKIVVGGKQILGLGSGGINVKDDG